MTAIVLLSGGLDSAVTAMIAADRDSDIHAVVFDYNQPELAYQIAKKIHAQTVDTVSLPWLDSSMPMRNATMMMIGASFADKYQAEYIYHWASESEPYHDCRREVFFSLQNAIMSGSEDAYPIIKTPLMDMTKLEIRGKAELFGLLNTRTGIYQHMAIC